MKTWLILMGLLIWAVISVAGCMTALEVGVEHGAVIGIGQFLVSLGSLAAEALFAQRFLP